MSGREGAAPIRQPGRMPFRPRTARRCKIAVFCALPPLNAPPRPAFHGPTFVRLLARQPDDPHPQGGLAPAERLSQWIDWTRAVVLSKVLDA